MKQDFLNLINQVDSIESYFHMSPSSPGLLVPPVEGIYDVAEFQSWIQMIQFELQEIVDKTSDKFAEETLAVARNKYNGWNDKTDFAELKGKLLAMKSHIDKYYPESGENVKIYGTKPPKIFISHATTDKEYVAKLVELLDGMGLNQTQVFCSSLPGYDIPVGKDIFDYLLEQFQNYELHVLLIHSKNYYKSAASLNEMGAAWVLRNNCTSFLLPGFNFEDMTGAINENLIAIKLDNDEVEVKDKLNQMYDIIINEFGLTKMSDIVWETKRNHFIKEVKEIVVSDEEQQEKDEDLELLDSGLLIKKSEREAGKNIYYCYACYQNTGKLFPVVKGSLAKDKFCSNCKMRYSVR